MREFKCGCCFEDEFGITFCPTHKFASAMFDALKDAQKLFHNVLPQFNWGASALDAEAIRLLNEIPSKVNRVVNKIEKRLTTT